MVKRTITLIVIQIRKVWKNACDVPTLRKAIMQFRPRLEAVVKENGGPIKIHFG